MACGQLELLFHGILHLKKPLVGLFAFFILVPNKGGQLKKSPCMINMGATFVGGWRHSWLGGGAPHGRGWGATWIFDPKWFGHYFNPEKRENSPRNISHQIKQKFIPNFIGTVPLIKLTSLHIHHTDLAFWDEHINSYFNPSISSIQKFQDHHWGVSHPQYMSAGRKIKFMLMISPPSWTLWSFSFPLKYIKKYPPTYRCLPFSFSIFLSKSMSHTVWPVREWCVTDRQAGLPTSSCLGSSTSLCPGVRYTD